MKNIKKLFTNYEDVLLAMNLLKNYSLLDIKELIKCFNNGKDYPVFSNTLRLDLRITHFCRPNGILFSQSHGFYIPHGFEKDGNFVCFYHRALFISCEESDAVKRIKSVTKWI